MLNPYTCILMIWHSTWHFQVELPFWHHDCHDMDTLSVLLAFCEGNPLATDGFLKQRASNAESVSMPWYYHDNNMPWMCLEAVFWLKTSMFYIEQTPLTLAMQTCNFLIRHSLWVECGTRVNTLSLKNIVYKYNKNTKYTFYNGTSWGPFYSHGLTLMPAWISNCIHYKV